MKEIATERENKEKEKDGDMVEKIGNKKKEITTERENKEKKKDGDIVDKQEIKK